MSAARRPGRPKGGGMQPDEARHLLLDAAEACFARLGFDKTTVDDVADEAGVSRRTVYRYVSGRDELLTGVLARITDRFTTALAEGLDPSAPLGEYIVESMSQVVELARADPGLAAMFVGADRRAASQAVVADDEIRHRARAFAHQVLEQAGPERRAELRSGISVDDAADHLVLIGLALIEGYGPIEPDEVRRYLADFVVPALVRRG